MRSLIVLLLASCTSVSTITPYGDNFLVSAGDAGGVTGREELQVVLVDLANAHCTQRGLKMRVIEDTATGNRWTGTGARLVFACK